MEIFFAVMLVVVFIANIASFVISDELLKQEERMHSLLREENELLWERIDTINKMLELVMEESEQENQ